MKKVLLLLTGGTIMMKKGLDNSLNVEENIEELNPCLCNIISSLKERISIDIECLFNIDSTDITIDCWQIIANCIYENYDSYDGFVVSHGTDTMAYSASAVSFMLRNIAKPVVFTGAQLPLSSIYTDGTNNLINSLLLAADYDIGEVCILFGTKIIRSTRARKVSAFDLQAFESINSEPLGNIGLKFKLNDNVRGRRKHTRIKFSDEMTQDVVFIKVNPGLSAERFKKMTAGVKGVVLQGFGAGNIPRKLFYEIESLVKKNIPVVVCTQCLVGKAELELYKVGKELSGLGVISGHDMTPEAATVKLMWVLGQTDDKDKIYEYFSRDLVGELS